MRRTASSRRMRLLATALLVALAFAAGSVVAALGDDALTYYACASPSGVLGQIRIGTAPDCGPNATLVSWESGTTPQTVSWNDLTDVPVEIENRVAADVDCEDAAGCVDGSEILDGSVTSDDLSPDSVTSATILDGTVTGADLASDSVGSSNVVDGSLTTSDRRANAQMATRSDDPTVGLGSSLTLPVVLDQPGDGRAHLVELQTQARVRCLGPNCEDGAVVSVELRADGVAVATVPLQLPATGSMPVTLSWVVTHALVSSVTPHTYDVTFRTSDDGAQFFDPMIYAIDLGTVGP